MTVLPDMNGLSAHFNSLTLPPDKSYDNLSLDLSVATSEGIAVLHGGVEIFSDVPKPKSTDTSSSRPQPNIRVPRGNKEMRKP